jgi:hypothetical protein
MPMGVPIRPGAWRPPTSENSSIYHQPSDKTWFLFTNHIGIEIAGESAPTPVFGTIGNFPLRDHGTIVKCLENDDPAVKCGCRRRLQENRRREHPRPADRGGAKMNGIPRCPGQPPSPPARPAANGNCHHRAMDLMSPNPHGSLHLPPPRTKQLTFRVVSERF